LQSERAVFGNISIRREIVRFRNLAELTGSGGPQVGTPLKIESSHGHDLDLEKGLSVDPTMIDDPFDLSLR